jgi:PAS domain S-box-containing protein
LQKTHGWFFPDFNFRSTSMDARPGSNPGPLRAVTRAACVCAWGIAFLDLVGWQSGNVALTNVLSGGPAMNPLTAVCVLLASTSLWFLNRTGVSPGSRKLAQACAALVMGCGAIRLVSLLTRVEVELDRVMFRSQLLASPVPTRMGLYTAIACVCVGLGLLMLDARSRAGSRIAEPAAFAGAGVSLTVLIGYAYAAPPLHGIMAFNTSIAFLVLSAGILMARPDRGICELLLGSSPGGMLARRVLPTAAVVPFVLGWLRLQGQQRGFYGLEFGTALLMLAIVGLVVWLVGMTARVLDAGDGERREAERALRKSVERQDLLLHANLIGVLTSDSTGCITEANQAFLEMIGRTREDLPIRYETITPAEWLDRSRTALSQISEHGKATPFEKEYLRKDGSRVPVLIGAASLPGVEREIVAFVIDLSGKRRAELEVDRMRLFLDSVFENLPNMVFVKDAEELRFIRMNRAGEELIGVSRDQLLGKNDYDFFPKEQADFFTAKDRSVLETNQLLDIPEEPLKTSSGETRILHTKKVPILDPEGVPRYLLGISEDVTARKQVEEDLVRLNEGMRKRTAELEAANKELEAFSYSVSHDLRAPLRHIDGFTDLLTRKAGATLDETGRRYLESISTSAKSMGQLIDDLLAFSRMSRTQMQDTVVDLGRLVAVARTGLEPETAGKDITWRIAALPAVRGDARMLQLVITNLLSNAVKYSGTQPKPEIEVGSREEAGELVLYVRDNGVGFDMSYAHKLFGVFQRLHGDEEFEGTGIGLANVRRVIHRHGGRTWAEGAVGRGATFYVGLPLALATAVKEAAV